MFSNLRWTRGAKDARIKFFRHINISHEPDGCWEWTAALDRNGYGVFGSKGTKTSYVHRWFFAQLAGAEFDKSLVVHHKCHNRKCVNPKHLEQLSRAENSRRKRPRKTN